MNCVTIMLENPMRNTCLIPHSFVMTRSECDYCSAKEHSYVMIEYLFGLKSCNEHINNANRDCRAFMHREGYVKLTDAYAHESIGPFLKELENGFPVIRTSGIVEQGWKLRKEKLKMFNSRWHIPAYTEEPVECTKYVAIEKFLDTRIRELLPINESSIRRAIEALDAGIYMKEAMEFEQCVDREASMTVEEPNSIVKGVTRDGRIVRVFQIGPASAAHPVAAHHVAAHPVAAEDPTLEQQA